MSKILIVGDTHFSPRTPVSRQDDYPTTLLNKLESLLQLSLQHKVEHLIFLGDLINTPQITLPYLFKLIQVFQKFKQQGIELHSIIGNHDLPHNNPDALSNTPIGLLYQIRLIDLNSFEAGGYTFNLYHYLTPVSQLPEAKDKKQIFIGHYFYQSGFNDTLHTLTLEQATYLHYHKYFLGHDHVPYEPIHNDLFEVHRPGSFSRASSDTCQIHRDQINVCLFNTETDRVEYLEIPNVLPASQVYFKDKLIKTDTIDLTELMSDFDNLINNITYSDTQELFSLINTLNLDQELQEVILEYLHLEGIYNS